MPISVLYSSYSSACFRLLTVFLFVTQNYHSSLGKIVPSTQYPVIINTWQFVDANAAGYQTLLENRSALDAVVSACQLCQEEECGHSVGWGGSPDESGETTLDAMIMDGPSHAVGAVAALENVKDAISVARAVLEHTDHTILVGNKATEFALQMGFKYEDLHSVWSLKTQIDWIQKDCQPNYWKHVVPNPTESCGPYTKQNIVGEIQERRVYQINYDNHDTIGVVAIDSSGRIACGTSTNGANHKIAGRVGDSPFVGAGSYLDQDVGGAAATGDGDIIMRYLLSYKTVEGMRNGLNPTAAAKEALKQVIKKYPKAQIGLVALNMNGQYGAACMNVDGGFPFSVATPNNHSKILITDCLFP